MYPINHEFWKQFNDPHRAYSNYYSFLSMYKNDLTIPCPTDNDLDYTIYAWKVAHDSTKVTGLSEKE